MARAKNFELRFPAAGIARRLGFHDSAQLRPPYPTPWSINCRPEDPLASRVRGGSRPGLTEYANDLNGGTIAAILSVPVGTSSGVASKLAVVADNVLGVYDDGNYSTPVGELLTEAGVAITTENDVEILVDTGGVPTSCFLCARGQKVYAVASAGSVSLDLITGVVDTLTATEGTTPSSVTLGCVYRDRLVLAGEDNAIYMSRQGDFRDWDYGADVEDSGRAVTFQLGEAAEHGALCTALVPFQDASLLAATQYGLWVLQGDPAATGTLRNVSRGVGIIGSGAWCLVQDARVGDTLVKHGIVFLATDGLYLVAPSGDGLKSLTDDRLPEELRGIAGTTTISLVYSPDERGVYIFLTPDSGSGTHWFYDLARGGFWGDVLQSGHQPLAVAWHDGSVLLAGKDGDLRTVGGEDDDASNIESHVLLGPLRAAAPGTFGQILNLRGVLAESSGAVTWRIVTGESAEEACSNGKTAIEAFQAGTSYSTYVAASGGLTAGRNTIVYPRVRAPWLVIWLQSTARWGYETMFLETGQSGKVR